MTSSITEQVIEEVAKHDLSMEGFLKVIGVCVLGAAISEFVSWLIFCLPIPFIGEGNGRELHNNLVLLTRKLEKQIWTFQEAKKGEDQKKAASVLQELSAEWDENNTVYNSSKMKSQIVATLSYFVGHNYLRAPFANMVAAKLPFEAIWPFHGILSQTITNPLVTDASMVGCFMLAMQGMQPVFKEVLGMTAPTKPAFEIPEEFITDEENKKKR